MGNRAGWIYRDSRFYVDAHSGELKPKYLLVLAAPDRDDIVFRLLTTRHAGLRPEAPPCHHGNPYSGFFLGVLGGSLTAKSWLDFRYQDDLDADRFAEHERDGRVRAIMKLPQELLRPAFECAAGADDTTHEQARTIRNALAAIPI